MVTHVQIGVWSFHSTYSKTAPFRSRMASTPTFEWSWETFKSCNSRVGLDFKKSFVSLREYNIYYCHKCQVFISYRSGDVLFTKFNTHTEEQNNGLHFAFRLWKPKNVFRHWQIDHQKFWSITLGVPTLLYSGLLE